MTYEDIISLGWKDRHPNYNSKNDKIATFVYEVKGFDYHIMSVIFEIEEDDGVFDNVMINCVPENTTFNEWENSDTIFYGDMKTKQELKLVMELLGIIKYEGI